MKEEQFKVLKTMSEATNRMDINMFAQKVNLTTTQTIQQIQELAKEGFLQKIGAGYSMTERGKVALKAFAPVPEGKGFNFYIGLGQPVNLTAQTLVEFYRAVKQASTVSLEFHVYRGDFENWLKETCKEPELAHEISHVKEDGLKSEELRAGLLQILDDNYHIKELA